jgi:HD-like signal output (HDOD) protein
MSVQNLRYIVNDSDMDLTQLIDTVFEDQDKVANIFELAEIDSKYYDIPNIIPDKF